MTIQLLRDHRSGQTALTTPSCLSHRLWKERRHCSPPPPARRLPRPWACSGHGRADTQPTMETHPRAREGWTSLEAQNLGRSWCGELSIEHKERKRSALPLSPGPLCPPLLGLGPRLVPFPGPPWPPVITGDGCLHAARSRASGPVLGEPCPARPARGPPGPVCPGLSWRPVSAPAQPLLTAPAPGRGGTVPAGCR